MKSLPLDPDKLVAHLKLDGGVGFLARVLAGRASSIFEEVTGQTEITPQQFGVLLTLYQNDPMTLTDLTRATRADRSTIGEMTRRMTQRGLIARAPGEQDRRTAFVSITEEGREALLELVSKMPLLQDRLLHPIPEAERRSFLHNLKLIAQG